MEINEDNIMIYELEEDPNFQFDALSPDKQSELEKVNDKYLHDNMDALTKYIQPDKHSPDNVELYAIVRTHRGVYEKAGEEFKPIMVVIRCKNCGKLEYFTDDPEPIMSFIARVYMESQPKFSAAASLEDKAKTIQSPEFLMENLETGEITDATEIVKQLSGQK